MRFAIYTLGCKVNQYETQAMERELCARGHELVDFESAADVYVINTCSVTAVSDKKSRQMIRRARKMNPEAVVAACGCYVQTHADEARELEVDLIAGTNDRRAFIDLLEEECRQRRRIENIDEALRRRTFEVLPAGGMAERTRAMMKVEDGCVNFCTYCIIPYARGPVRSLPMDVAREQVRELKAAGYKEIVVTGIEISSYGHDLKDGTTITDLLELICSEAGDIRIRLGSLEPRTITEDFCRRLSGFENLCPHFHLSLQSGCTTTLKRMNRKYDAERFLESVDLLRKWFDHPAITTDLIAGFPEETEEEFEETLAMIQKCAFADMHVFPYSIRPGTPAAKMKQVAPQVKEERAHRAAAVAEEMHRAYMEACVGRTYKVLFEQEKGEHFAGHAPNYMEVLAHGENLHNQVKNVKITGILSGSLVGEIVEE